MSSIEREKRRIEVSKLLDECMDEKLLRGGTDRAREKATEAWRFANQSPSLPTPWPELAAYRLALLELRSPDRARKLRQIDQLLEQAAGNASATTVCALGPLPLIYRLAVLQVRKEATPRDRRIEATIDQVFESARTSVEAVRLARHHETSPLQHAYFNLLELASFFLARPYPGLEGIGQLDPLTSKGWMLVAQDSSISDVHYSGELACAELEARGKRTRSTVLFKLDKQRNGSWKLASKPEWNEANPDQLKLLALRLWKPEIEPRELRDRLDPSEVNLRQIKHRLIQAFKSIVRAPPLFEGQRITREIAIIGAVELAALDRC